MAIHPLRDVPLTAFSQDPRGFAFWFDQTQWLGQDALYITLDRFAQDPDILAQYQPLFDDRTPDHPGSAAGWRSDRNHPCF